MSKTKIEWCDETINPVKGLCPMACSYCYARRMYKRFHWDEAIRFDGDALTDCNPPKPSKIFVGSTMELFGEWIPNDWLKAIFDWAKICQEHTFIFLTKQPQNLAKWSPFPDNCWVGVSTPDLPSLERGIIYLQQITAKVKFLSCEPLLSQMWEEPIGGFSKRVLTELLRDVIDWLIIGQQTPVSAKTQPKIEWIKEIVDAAGAAGVPVFLKDNLKDFLIEHDAGEWAFSCMGKLRQEFPRIKR